MIFAESGLPDYRNSRPSEPSQALHQSLEWMKKTPAENSDKTKIVVSHHAQSMKSLPEAKYKDLVSAAYAWHLDDRITGEIYSRKPMVRVGRAY